MCTLTKEINKKEFTGYKLVYLEGNKIMSPVLGIEYKEGMTLPKLTVKTYPREKLHKRIYEQSGWVTPAEILKSFFKDNMQGRTAVFVRLEDAKTNLNQELFDIKDQSILGIAEMTISEDLMEGEFDFCDVVAGRKINKIKLLDL